MEIGKRTGYVVTAALLMLMVFAGGVAADTTTNIFYYEKFTGGTEVGELPTGIYYLDGDTTKFITVTEGENNIEISDLNPKGLYSHQNSDTTKTYIHLQSATLSKKLIHSSGSTAPITSTKYDSVVYVDIDYAIYKATVGTTPGIEAKLAFKKSGEEGTYLPQLAEAVETVSAGKKFSFKPGNDTNKNLGTWEIYANFSEYMTTEAPESSKYVLVGSLDVRTTSAEETASVSISKNEVRDGVAFSIAVTGPKNRPVHLMYYESGKTYPDDAKDVTGTSEIAYYSAPTNPQQYYETDANGKVTINLLGKTGELTSKSFVIAVWVEGCTDENKGTLENPATVTVTIKGDAFTAELDKEKYALGANFKVAGTYEGDDISLFFYLEGTNTPMVKLTTAKKNNGPSEDYKVDGHKYYYVLDGAFTSAYNPGTYTLYITKEYVADNIGYTEDVRKKVVRNSISHTLTLIQPTIQILNIDKTVETGISASGKSKYLTIKVKAEAADAISLYIVGQNKMFFINGDDATTNNCIRTLKSDRSDYLFKEGADTNPYYYTNIAISSVTKVAEKLGQKVADSVLYPIYLIIDNRDGTFTIYLHIQDETELTEERLGKYPNEKSNNTVFNLGEYYVVLQHPMADGIFNTRGKSSSDGYGVDISTNGTFLFNVPALQNIEAAQALTSAITDGNDIYAGATITVVADAGTPQTISGAKDAYTQGEIITIVIDNTEYPDGVFATLEENEFEFDAENINYLKTFVIRETESNGAITKQTLTLDTSETPLGTYQIIIKGKENGEYKTIAIFDTAVTNHIVEPVVTQDEPVTPVQPSVPYIPPIPPEDTKSPFPILGILAGLGTAASIFRRK
ncbi:MAG TPA: hypothetical protein O0X25_03445 [Methanocorpusculum sp.]|nr:hypothetical protein [Methanocorpusculum sp.]HJJ40263.1 hypothetical protein [Methanocorpusculum sp.]HJJ49652.1 hypothetical protein [Methanocorpusculum sp.]HJJ57796.1 hypothetical protein [Methanocorpusculum sp.]